MFLTPKRKVRGREKIKGAAKEQIHENVDFCINTSTPFLQSGKRIRRMGI